MEGEFFSSSGMKRGPDDMQVKDGMGDANDAKKAKFDNGGNPPSRVVHIRSLPNDAAETDVVQLGMPFGKMTNVLVLKQKNQAFLEFADESNAVNMVSYYKTNPAQVRLKSCYVQFSTHKELKTDVTNVQNTNAQAALQAAQGILGSGNGNVSGLNVEPTSILRVIVDNVLYPVTLEVLHQLFSRYGKILKIITFNKNNTFQALIQFADHISAVTAKDVSEDIYILKNDMGMGGAGVLGSGANAMMGGLGGMGGGAFNLGGNMANQLGNRMGNMPGMNQTNSVSPCILVSNLDEERVTPDALFVLFGVYGNVHRVKILFNKKDNALVQMADASQALQAITYLDKARVWGKQLRVASSKHQLIQMPKDGQSDAGLTKDYVLNEHHRFRRVGSKNYIFPPTAMLHLYNVATLEEEDIRSMFSNYGTVKAFKFLPDKDRKMALIEMSSVEEATLALIGLHNYQVGNKVHLRVSFSRSTI
ncbi:polypyrimidine tract-binding protein [Elysia marginata]|uniref:Polypyrimidine tract-binding protein n=1 Tax=Elysia marginata TaxID=1093978 RepID=A0AAV4I5G9_9GAST|nr:polypyrimidine tract-binding protein [Elysia marginata]